MLPPGPTGPPSDQNTDTAHDLAERVGEFVAALRRGDVHAAMDLYSDDARLLPPGTDAVAGRGSIEQFWQAGVDAGVSDVEFDPIDVRGHGRNAYEIGRYVLYVNGDGGPVADRGHYMRVHVRNAEGIWACAVEMLSPDPAGAKEDDR